MCHVCSYGVAWSLDQRVVFFQNQFYCELTLVLYSLCNDFGSFRALLPKVKQLSMGLQHQQYQEKIYVKPHERTAQEKHNILTVVLLGSPWFENNGQSGSSGMIDYCIVMLNIQLLFLASEYKLPKRQEKKEKGEHGEVLG